MSKSQFFLHFLPFNFVGTIKYFPLFSQFRQSQLASQSECSAISVYSRRLRITVGRITRPCARKPRAVAPSLSIPSSPPMIKHCLRRRESSRIYSGRDRRYGIKKIMVLACFDVAFIFACSLDYLIYICI